MNLAFLRIGDVVRIHGLEYVVDMVNDCRARCQPIEKGEKTVQRTKTYKRPGGKVEKIVKTKVVRRFGPRDESISPRAERSSILRYMTQDEMKPFLVQAKTIQPTAPEPEENNGWVKASPEGEESVQSKDKVMAKKNAEVKINKVGKGRATLVHQLRNEGKNKQEAWEIAHEEFPNQLGEEEPNNLFNKIWARGAKSVEPVATAKPKSTPPAKKKTTPPVPAPPAAAAT